MARGWESKAVESQIESAQDRNSHVDQPRLPPEELALEREREGLELSRKRVLDDISTAQNPKYLEQLQRTLEFLDAKLAKFSGQSH